MDNAHGPAAADPWERRRGVSDRRTKHDRRDRYQGLTQRIALGAGTLAGVYGQAELLGEPWRHIVTIGAFALLAGVALWMKET